MHEIDRIRVAPQAAIVYEHGWQSWSSSTSYPLHAGPLRPRTENSRIMNCRQDTRPPADVFWGEGLLAVDPGDGSGIVVFSAAAGAAPHGESPTVWCSWYQYFRKVTEDDIFENLAAMDDLGLDVDVVQIDDGYQAEIGDWLTESGRFASLESAVARIRGTGRRAGLWLAPFLISPRSAVYAEHPGWLVGGARAGFNWEAEQAVLDITHPGAEEYLRTAFGTLRRMGIDYFKLDFLYAGALAGAGRRSHRPGPGLAARPVLGERHRLPHRAAPGAAP